MQTPPFLTADNLNQPRIRHGFFGRAGGVSKGQFASLNTGFGSDDLTDHVAENRTRCARVLGVSPERLLTVHQTHSPDVIIVDGPWKDKPKQADAMVTTIPGLAIGALAADCMPWLFCDVEAGVIGTAHAGWRGALAGVLQNTVATMTTLGADPARILAAIGPCMRQENFEVGLDLVDQFCAAYPGSDQYFAPGRSGEKRQFDLVAFGRDRLRDVGVTNIDDVGVCTLGQAGDYFSYRAMKRDGGTDYGRNLSAISIG